LVAVIVLGAVVGSSWALPPQCSPDVLRQTDNPKIIAVCEFLQSYANDGHGPYEGLSYPIGLIDNGVKRQDVDHVFLRFGRRRR
jgi:hypothetical protein